MRNRRTFLYRLGTAIDRRGDGEGYAGGVLDAPVKACRPQGRQIRPADRPRRETKPHGEAAEPTLPGKTPRQGPRRPYQNRHRWAGRAYRGDRGNHGQGTRHNRSVTSGEGVPLQVEGLLLPEPAAAAAKRPKRLFTKNTGLCQPARGSIGSDACPVPEGYADALASKRSAEAKPR